MKPQHRNNNRRRHKSSASNAFAYGIFSSVGGSLAKKALSLLEIGDYKSLVSLEINPSDYSDIDEFRDDYLVAELMSKYPSWDTGIDKEKVALEKFLQAEQACAETNIRLRSRNVAASTTVTAESYIYTARRKIARLLGPFDWDEAAAYFAWGPGASTQVRSVQGDAYYKYGVTRPQVTRSCALLAGCVIAQSPVWYMQIAGLSSGASFAMPSPWLIARDHFDMVEGNRIVTVPKNAKTDRVIAIEPHMNMYVQKGIGAVIRRRLLKAGVDLNDQTRNQRLAREGSLSGMLATVDLSAASDTISMELVEQLLPEDWVLAIKQTRSPVGVTPNGERVAYQKVSSMGNGFTFELESLIFWALVSSVVDYNHEVKDRRIGVYGDDLIFSVTAYHQVVSLLSFVGFKTNDKKSFTIGWFRESCGKHYFHGSDVSPFYVREDIDSNERLLWAANQVRRYASQRYGCALDGRLLDVYLLCVQKLPCRLRRPTIPDGYGDGALFGDLDECLPFISRATCGLEGFLGTVLLPVPRRTRVSGGALLLKALGRKSEVCFWKDHIPTKYIQSVVDRLPVGRSDTILTEGWSTRVHRILVPQWIDKGAWV